MDTKYTTLVSEEQYIEKRLILDYYGDTYMGYPLIFGDILTLDKETMCYSQDHPGIIDSNGIQHWIYHDGFNMYEIIVYDPILKNTNVLILNNSLVSRKCKKYLFNSIYLINKQYIDHGYPQDIDLSDYQT